MLQLGLQVVTGLKQDLAYCMEYDASNIKILRQENIDYSTVDISFEGFKQNLHKASIVARNFARTFVFNELPDQIHYKIYNGIMEEKYMSEGEIVIQDAVYNGFEVKTESQVIASLWRDGYVPVWINVQVESQTKTSTMLSLICGSRFSSNPKLIYHIHEGMAPFHVLGPPLPPNWKSVEENGKYNLYWRKNRDIKIL